MTDSQSSESFLARGLSGLALLCFRFPKLTLLLCFSAAALGVGISAARLELQMDWTYLFERSDPVVQRVERARDIFPLSGDIAVLVDQGTPAQREATIAALGERLEAEPDLFYQVFYRVDLQPLASKALFFLEEKELNDLMTGLKNLAAGTSAGGEGSGNASDASKRILVKLLDDLERSLVTRGRAEYEPIWEFLAEGRSGDAVSYLRRLLNGERYVYTTIGKGQVNVLLFHTGPWGQAVAPKDAAVRRVREIITEVTPTVQEVRIRLTGLPVMLTDERKTISEDGVRSSAVSITLILLIFAVGFGEVSRPAFSVLALSVGLCWTMGITAVTIGHLNFITASLVTMLMGMGIDFGIHLLFRYDEEMGGGLSPAQALRATVQGTGVDTLVGATATSVAFLALTFADFRGISEFGIIAALGTMLCLFSTVTVLPAMLAIYPGKPRPPVSEDGAVAWIEKQILRRARLISVAGFLFLLLCLFWSSRVGFSYNLLEVQAPEIDSVRTELEMVNQMKRSVLSGQLIVKGEDQAREYVEKLEKLSSVSGVGSVVQMLPKVTPERQAKVNEIVKLLPHLKLPEEVRLDTAKDLIALRARLAESEQQSAASGTAGDPEIAKEIDEIKEAIAKMDPGPIQDGLTVFQDNVRADFSNMLDFLQKQKAEPPTMADLPPHLVIRYVSPDGHHKLSVSAEKNIWEREHLEEFLDQTMAVAPEMVGHPVIQKHILTAFHRAFDRTPWYILAGVLSVMVLYLRSVRAVFLSLLPTATGVLVIFAAMGYTGINFNVVNFVALPMSVGIGAIYGVHSLHRMWELNDEKILTSSTGPALLLSGLTTLIGFASLMTADHRGMSTLGFVISVGVLVNFGGSLVFLPALRRAMRMRDSLDLTGQEIS